MSKKQKTKLVAVFMPNATHVEIRAEVERLLNFDREDNDTNGHGVYLGPGPKIVRVVSVSPDIYVGGFSDFGPEQSRPLAKKKLVEVVN